MINQYIGFRGSDVKNILNFEKDFPGTKIIKLEQNYRCTGNILKAAKRMKKEIFHIFFVEKMNIAKQII